MGGRGRDGGGGGGAPPYSRWWQAKQRQPQQWRQRRRRSAAAAGSDGDRDRDEASALPPTSHPLCTGNAQQPAPKKKPRHSAASPGWYTQPGRRGRTGARRRRRASAGRGWRRPERRRRARLHWPCARGRRASGAGAALRGGGDGTSPPPRGAATRPHAGAAPSAAAVGWGGGGRAAVGAKTHTCTYLGDARCRSHWRGGCSGARPSLGPPPHKVKSVDGIRAPRRDRSLGDENRANSLHRSTRAPPLSSATCKMMAVVAGVLVGDCAGRELPRRAPPLQTSLLPSWAGLSRGPPRSAGQWR